MPNTRGSSGYLKRANTERLHEIFNQYASQEKNGERFMTASDFVRSYLGLYTDADYNPNSVNLLAGIVDTSKDGLISFAEFQVFEGLLCVPDALYKTAFQLFDTNGNGMVAFDEFAEVMRKTVLHQKMPFNMDSSFIKLYFGKDKSRLISYAEFSQFLHDGDFSVEDKPRFGQPKIFEDKELEALPEEDQSQTQEKLAESLGVTQQAVSVRLSAMGMIKK
ncbi:PREDICTED: calcium-binding mitochondrial carrier protein Aralar1-like [Cyphomyrmex costatus]|uniref:calcium-binding mitochondrial carrier protein Aralar1-like n=1 Tax=Cyphomyrmex costatus TaxID=456900 RepID=UPI0008523C9F|nr:PREDICTED: calcium-binding mitochondrial carrier protein Aralar1-like [Cyphomyrmex costatus]